MVLALLLPFGPHAPLLLVLGLAFLPIQLTLAWAVREGRAVAPLVVLVAPAMLLGAGGVAAGAALDAAWEAVRNSAGALDDPAWIPWVALVGRARALGPVALGAGLAAVLSALPLGGALFRRSERGNPGAAAPTVSAPPPAGKGRRGTSPIVLGLLGVGGAAAGVIAGAGAFAGVSGLDGLLVLAGACAGVGVLAAGAAARATGPDGSAHVHGAPVAGRSAGTVPVRPLGGADDDLDLDEDSMGGRPSTDEVSVEDEEATVSMRAAEVAALDDEDITAPRVGRGAAPAPARPPAEPKPAAPPPTREVRFSGTHLVAACAVLLVTSLALAVTAAVGMPVPEALAMAARGEAAPAAGAALHADYALRVSTAGWFAAAAAAAFAVCAVPALLHGGGLRGLANLTLAGLTGAAALAPLVSSRLHADALATHAGAQAVAVYEAALSLRTPGGDPREGDPLPPRILVASPENPRWLNLRPRGGLETLPVVPGDGIDEATLFFGGAGRSVGHGDGILLPPDLSAVDFYLLLADSRATEVAVVTCGALPVALGRLASDPLLATGVCGPVRLHLRRPPGARQARSFIVLKDREVDAEGDIVAIDALGQVRGPVLVRLQTDATMSDLFALLARLSEAGPVLLGWGVDLDGGEIPVGVRP